MVRASSAAAGLAILGLLGGCGLQPPGQPPAPLEQRAPGPAPAPAAPAAPAPAAAAVDTAPAGTVLERARARWVAVDWSELPGLADDDGAGLWPALQAGCARPAAGWSELCARALLDPPPGADGVRRWLMEHLQAWRVEAADGSARGLATGYFEPTVNAVRAPRDGFRVALHGPPAELSAAAAPRRPFYTRQQLDTLPQAMATLRGREIAWIEDPLDALLLQVQGSGRLRIAEPDGRTRVVRLAFAAHNDQPYRSVGRWLIEQGELGAEAASWPAIRDWARRNPRRVQELLWSNPRVVFFREEALPDPAVGPRGALGVALTPGRSIAVDPQAVPHGAVAWIDTTEPLSDAPLRRLVLAQDSGGAITGAVRVDLFFGWTRDAETLAGRMKQPLRLWALWPRGRLPGALP